MNFTDRTICSGNILVKVVADETIDFSQEQSHFPPFKPMTVSPRSPREEVAGPSISARSARSMIEPEARGFRTQPDPKVDPRLTSDHRHGPGD
jgi:hypothetical protein